MNKYKIFIQGTHELSANFKDLIIKKERTNVQDRLTLENTITIGGNELGDDYDYLRSRMDAGKISFKIQEYNGILYEDIAYGYLQLDADWDDTKKIVVTQVESYNEYTKLDDSKDYEYSCEQRAILSPTNITNFGTKFSTKFPFTPVKYDEIERVEGNASGAIDPDGAFWNNTPSGYQELFNGNTDKINRNETWYGARWNNNNIEPYVHVKFKTPRAVKEIRLYADSKWDLKQGVVVLYDPSGFNVGSYATAPIPEDPTFVPHEQIHTFTNEVYNVLSIVVTYDNLVAADDWYEPIEYKIYTDHDESSETTDIVYGTKNNFIGAKPFRMVLADMLNDIDEILGGTEFFKWNDILRNNFRNLLLKLEGTELFDALVIPSEVLTGDDGDPTTFTTGDVINMLGEIFHKYLRIEGDLSSGATTAFTNGQAELMKVIDIDYSVIGKDLTNYKSRNWSEIQSQFTSSALAKPRRLVYDQTSKNDLFGSGRIDFKQAPTFTEDQDVDFGAWEFDIMDVLLRPDQYSSKIFLADCTATLTGANKYQDFSNTSTDLLLNGSTWTNTSLTDLDLTNNSSSPIEITTNLISLTAGDSIRIISNTINNIRVRIWNTAEFEYYHYINTVDGVAEFTVGVTGNYRVKLSIPTGVSFIRDFEIKTVEYEINEVSGEVNKNFSMNNLLVNNIAEMPYSPCDVQFLKVNNNWQTTDVLNAPLKPDKRIAQLEFPVPPEVETFPILTTETWLRGLINLDTSFKTDLGTVQPLSISRIANEGNFINLDGYLYQDPYIDIRDFSYSGDSNVFTDQDTDPTCFNFKNSFLYIGGNTNKKIYKYYIPFNLSNPTYFNDFLDVSGEVTGTGFLADFKFNRTGDSVYVVDSAHNIIFQYYLSTPYQLSTGSYSGKSFTLTTPFINSFELNTKGDKFYHIEPAPMPNLGKAHQYYFGNEDISTAINTGEILNFGDESEYSDGLSLDPAGKNLITIGVEEKKLFQYRLPTSDTLTGGTYMDRFLDISSQCTTPTKIILDNDEIYVLDSSNYTIFRYSR